MRKMSQEHQKHDFCQSGSFPIMSDPADLEVQKWSSRVRIVQFLHNPTRPVIQPVVISYLAITSQLFKIKLKFVPLNSHRSVKYLNEFSTDHVLAYSPNFNLLHLLWFTEHPEWFKSKKSQHGVSQIIWSCGAGGGTLQRRTPCSVRPPEVCIRSRLQRPWEHLGL